MFLLMGLRGAPGVVSSIGPEQQLHHPPVTSPQWTAACTIFRRSKE